jgi:hypothetical protein
MATVPGQAALLDVTNTAIWNSTPSGNGVSVTAGQVTAASGTASGTQSTVTATYDGYTASVTVTVN